MDELGGRGYFWVRTADHPCANNRTPHVGEKQWNLDFEDEDGRIRRVHVGELTRQEFLKMLADDKVKTFTAEHGAVNEV